MSAPHVLQPTIEQNLHAIASLLDRAFAPSNYESRLVALLVRNHRQIHHWTLQSRDRILAYACYSRAYHGNQMIGYHLGATLNDAALQSQAIFVLGHPAYYPLVGFRRIEQPVCPFDEGTNTSWRSVIVIPHPSPSATNPSLPGSRRRQEAANSVVNSRIRGRVLRVRGSCISDRPNSGFEIRHCFGFRR